MPKLQKLMFCISNRKPQSQSDQLKNSSFGLLKPETVTLASKMLLSEEFTNE